MFFVVAKHIKTGRQACVNKIFDTEKDAISHVAMCYEIDKNNELLGEYCYFIEQR